MTWVEFTHMAFRCRHNTHLLFVLVPWVFDAAQGNLLNRSPTAAEAEEASAHEIRPLDEAKPPLVPSIPAGRGADAALHHVHPISGATKAAAVTVGSAMHPSEFDVRKMRPPQIVKCVLVSGRAVWRAHFCNTVLCCGRMCVYACLACTHSPRLTQTAGGYGQSRAADSGT